MNDETYISTDLGEATALYSFGFDLLELQKTSRPGQRAFVFCAKQAKVPEWAKETTPDDLIRAYRSRAEGVLIDAYSFYLAGKELKSRLFDDIEENGE